MSEPLDSKEAWFWKAASLALGGVIIFSVALSLHYPWEKPVFPNSDFEKGDLTNWGVEGTAFRRQPVYGDNVFYRNRGTANLQGKYWVGTFDERPNASAPKGAGQGDEATGRLVSMDFTIARKRIGFLMGGGDNSRQVGVGLEVDGKMVLFEAPRGKAIDSEKMSRYIWNVSKWRGQKARFVLLDQSAAGWGHLNADDFRYT